MNHRVNNSLQIIASILLLKETSNNADVGYGLAAAAQS
jgi:two-component sensor histidine kinase